MSEMINIRYELVPADASFIDAIGAAAELMLLRRDWLGDGVDLVALWRDAAGVWLAGIYVFRDKRHPRQVEDSIRALNSAEMDQLVARLRESGVFELSGSQPQLTTANVVDRIVLRVGETNSLITVPGGRSGHPGWEKLFDAFWSKPGSLGAIYDRMRDDDD